MHDKLNTIASLDAKGMSTRKELDEYSRHRRDRYLARWVDSQAIADHFLREYVVRHAFQFNNGAVERGKHIDLCHYAPAPPSLSTTSQASLRPFRMRFMRVAIRSDCVPITTCAILPRLITPEAPRLLRRASSISSGVLMKRRSRVMQPSTLWMFSLPPSASITSTASTSSRSSVAVAVAAAPLFAGFGPRWLSGRIQSVLRPVEVSPRPGVPRSKRLMTKLKTKW